MGAGTAETSPASFLLVDAVETDEAIEDQEVGAS
jgi:hypothetical protein